MLTRSRLAGLAPKIGTVVLFLATLSSPALAGLACFDGPHLDHEDKQFAYWNYTNHCGSSVTLNYEIQIEGGKSETGTTSVAACQDGSLIDSRGHYEFELVPAEGSKQQDCGSKKARGEADTSDDLLREPPHAAPRGPQNRAPIGAEATSPGFETGPGNPDDQFGGGPAAGVASQLGTTPGPNRCWVQSSVRWAKLVCCASLQLCERICVYGAKGNGAASCHTACSGAAERAPAGLSCYWQH